ncbi:MAG: RnfH family protein [Acidiferrobacterales bacterium]
MAMIEVGRSISVQVVYATPDKKVLKKITVPENTTVEIAITSSGLLREFPEIDLLKNDVGVFSERRQLNDSVHEGDRIEIYRPLIADPKEVRRQRARESGGNN